MSRTHRLFDLLQTLRRHRQPVSGAALAREAGVSLRTLYRDIAALQAIGAEIEGEPGLGYVLKPGFLLPPLMLSAAEIEALALGAQWVARRTDEGLSHAARNAMAKIAAVLPPAMRQKLEDDALIVGQGWERRPGGRAERAEASAARRTQAGHRLLRREGRADGARRLAGRARLL